MQIQSSDEETSKIQRNTEKSHVYASYSGYGNNLQHPTWGKAMSALHRLVPPAYSDGYQSFAGKARPNPRLISNVLCQQTAADVLSAEDLNEMHVHFGQLVAHDTDFSSPFANTLATENMAIEIPSGDPYFDPFSTGRQMMRFRRSARQPNSGDFKDFPREQVYIRLITKSVSKFQNFYVLLCWKLESVVARITTHLKHCHATKFCCWKNLLKKVDASSTCCNMLLQLATTKFCCVTMFEVGR